MLKPPPASRLIGPVIVGAAVLAGGCSSYVAPTLQVVDARVTDRTDEGVALAFSLDATNVNDEALPLRVANYTVELDGKKVFEGTRLAEATLRRRGTQQITLPAGVPAAALPSDGQARFRLSGTLQYVTPGALAELLFDTGVRRPKTDFVQRGVIDLAAAPSPPPPVVDPATGESPAEHP